MDWLDLVNNVKPSEDILMSSFAEDGVFRFEDGFTIPNQTMIPTMCTIFKSFPNFKMINESVKEVEPGLVLVENQVVSGTHYGTPFTFDSKYPPISRTDR